MTGSPTATVCIPTYNRSGLLRASLQSVLWQSLRDVEVIVSDNASTDDTEDVVRSLRDPRVIYHRNPDQHVIEFFAELDQVLDEELGYFDPRPWHADRPQRPKVWSRDNRAVAGWGPPPTADYHLNRDD